MRPFRLLLALSSSLIAVTLLLYVTLVSQQDEQLEQKSASREQGGFKALLSFTSPGSLFPPSAIISLTDDNSTFFLARPAAFGPTLPKDGLSSGLWIGSGFGDDTLGKGELGCGDSLDWVRHSDGIKLGSGPVPSNDVDGKSDQDGAGAASTSTAVHDIQSLQESAEIDGKVVLLKRGQCGFLAKVLWAQKRGAVAVIVGDNVRGGALIRMYAQGDTSNVTIPSLFTSHTTAHLLSSLLPGGTAHRLSPGIHADTGGNKDGEDKTEQNKGETIPPSELPQNSSRIPRGTITSTKPEPLGDMPSMSVPAENSDQGKSWANAMLSALGKGRGHGDQSGNSFQRPSSPGKFAWENDQRSGVRSNNDNSAPEPKHAHSRSVTSITDVNSRKINTVSDISALHEGLWVTLTPTNVSTSPFFDTLLVLVVSPLVTLTVVYALLLLRSRIRRRRWRAPKSLVERLPVRTYQTISDSTTSATPSASSPTTPLLQHSSNQPTSPTHSRNSRSEEEEPATSAAAHNTSRTREEEKRESGLAEWRRRYGGRQRECVVCLDEYVDGISQVMSLPCGHEFHADCITPWLVTRRRTCPICKGDVVRSLAQSHHDRIPSPSPTRSSRHMDSLDDVQAQAAEIRNDSPSASLPMPITVSAPTARSGPLADDVEANWSGDEAGSTAEDPQAARGTDLGTSFRELSSTVSTVIWRGVEVVRNTTGFQRRPPDGIDRDR